MASLYDTSANARRALLLVLVLIVGIFFYDFISRFFTQQTGTPTTQFSYYKDADLALQNVPRLSITSISTDTTITPTYTLERGPFADFPAAVYVYKIEQPREKLDTVQNSVSTAAVLGFTSTCIRKQDYQGNATTEDRCTYDGNDYTWVASQGSKVLKFNKSTQTWSMETAYFNNIDYKRLGALATSTDTYTGSAVGLLNQMGFGDSFGLSTAHVEFMDADLNQAGAFFRPEQSAQSKLMFLEVYRNFRLADVKKKEELEKFTSDKKVLDNIPAAKDAIVYTSDPRNGELRIVAGNNMSDFKRDVFKFNFTDFEYAVRGTTKGIYPVIGPNEAWTKAQTGKGFLVYLLPENANPFETYPGLAIRRFIADATKTTIGYFESETWNGFTTPIYVFKGRAELEDGRQASFTIYVDAIKRLD